MYYNYDETDAFLEGYSDALIEMMDDDDYEDAYLEGYYTALDEAKIDNGKSPEIKRIMRKQRHRRDNESTYKSLINTPTIKAYVQRNPRNGKNTYTVDNWSTGHCRRKNF